MLSLDDRTGNVLTTVVVFAVAAAVLYLARVAFLIFVISILFAFLIEPAVHWFQMCSPFRRAGRTFAIAQVYFAGIVVLGFSAYQFGPRVAAQAHRLNSSLAAALPAFASDTVAPVPASGAASTAPMRSRVLGLLVRHRDFLQHILERGAASIAGIAGNSIWLFAVPILAIFILRDGRRMARTIVRVVEPPERRMIAERVLLRIDTMLANYVRAQLALAGLSFVFYSVSMFLLGFPDAIALGAFGGALEFLPAVGWILSAASILTVGFLSHSHWIWMALLLVVWRLVQNYVNSPRIMGNSLELEPLTVVFGLMVGAQVGGVAGLFLSVPAIAALRIVWLECFARSSSTDQQTEPLAQARM